MASRDPGEGWWRCCSCGLEISGDWYFDTCPPDCNHARCEVGCYWLDPEPSPEWVSARCEAGSSLGLIDSRQTDFIPALDTTTQEDSPGPQDPTAEPGKPNRDKYEFGTLATLVDTDEDPLPIIHSADERISGNIQPSIRPSQTGPSPALATKPNLPRSSSFKCFICQKTFALKFQLKSHKKTHKKFPCTFEGCNRTFMDSQGRSQHLDSFHKKKLPCAVEGCNRRFRDIQGRLQHLKSVHKKTYKECPRCHCVFNRKDKYDVHTRLCRDPKQMSGKENSDEKKSGNLISLLRPPVSPVDESIARLIRPSVDQETENVDLRSKLSRKYHEDEQLSIEFHESPRAVEDHAPEAVKVKSISRSSSIASIADSLLSMASMSSRSSLSSFSGLEGATQRFAWVISHDDILRELWNEATEKISLERLERNLGKLLLVLAKDLKSEAELVTEKHVARLGSPVGKTEWNFSLYPWKSNLEKPTFEKAEQSDDSEANEYEANEYDNEPGDLERFEEFITQSRAFDTFRANVQKFIRPSLAAHLEDQKHLPLDLLCALPFFNSDEIPLGPDIPTIGRFLFPGLQYLNRKGNSWFRNPPLQKGMKRVTWTCSCGSRMYDDYEELERGAAKRLQRDLRHRSRAGDARQRLGYHENLSNASAGARSLILGVENFLSTSYRKFTTRTTPRASTIPFEMESQRQQPPRAVPQRTTPTEHLFLLLCIAIGAGKSVSKAYQPTVHDLDSDKAFFQMLRRYHTSIRQRWWSWISIWGLQNIYFVNFDLYEGSLVDIRELHAVPDPSAGTYKYEPTPYKPPIGSNLLMHHYRHPNHASTIKPCLGKVPKKVDTELTVCPVKGVSPGWGLHFEEGWCWKKILTWSCLVFILASVLEGILCWRFEHSIQDAMAIGTFILTCFGIAAATLQTWLMIS
ncbi:uncharacterized protein PAC_06249 [Phialocephala subalpina]|uniref:C2H2-type domain-containing protein n=1 Tax=Phialocephala subalpina TaxID=576137 RepID=A0A1L7WU98_9HELO|nr:uncharacterized protein PAC_06249 [Phialocephala subalpina]